MLGAYHMAYHDVSLLPIPARSLNCPGSSQPESSGLPFSPLSIQQAPAPAPRVQSCPLRGAGEEWGQAAVLCGPGASWERVQLWEPAAALGTPLSPPSNPY